MRKHSTHRPITPRVPMMVVMHNLPDLSLTERLSVEAFAGGWANSDHYDNLADCRNIMTLAAAEKQDAQALEICDMGYVALSNIRDRRVKTGRLGASGEELKALRAMTDFSEDWWKRQAGGLFERHYVALKAAQAEQKKGN